MSLSTLGSSIALVGVAITAWLLVHALFRRISSIAVALVLVVMMSLAGAAGVFLVDTNVPLSQSHFRPGGEPAPGWVALLAWGTRIAALMGLLYFARWSRSRGVHASPLSNNH